MYHHVEGEARGSDGNSCCPTLRNSFSSLLFFSWGMYGPKAKKKKETTFITLLVATITSHHFNHFHLILVKTVFFSVTWWFTCYSVRCLECLNIRSLPAIFLPFNISVLYIFTRTHTHGLSFFTDVCHTTWWAATHIFPPPLHGPRIFKVISPSFRLIIIYWFLMVALLCMARYDESQQNVEPFSSWCISFPSS